MKVHVDINIFMDLLTRRAGWFESFSTIDTLKLRRISGHISALTIAILHFLRMRKVREPLARTEVKTITQDFKITPLTRPILIAALDSPMPDFEDNIQFYSAKRCGLTTSSPATKSILCKMKFRWSHQRSFSKSSGF